MPIQRCDGALLRGALLGALHNLDANRDEVNRLNVFPVPDGDTGTNMLLTLQAAVDEVQQDESDDVSVAAGRMAHGSLMGARGNSGVILSQIFRGFSKSLSGHHDVDARQLADAFQEAANAAYRAVLKPQEGTILTVARAAAEAARAAVTGGDTSIPAVIRAAAEGWPFPGDGAQVLSEDRRFPGARGAVNRPPKSQPAILAQAGGVDAGGYGLQLILEGFLLTVAEGQSLSAATRAPRATVLTGAVGVELPEEGWGYCTEFLIEGDGMAVDDVRRRITELGNSTLVVGEPELIRVHVHTEEPDAVMAYARTVGRLSRIKVEDMTQQHREVLREAPEAPVAPAPALRANGVGLVAVASGPGLQRMFQELGVDAVVQGGQSMNPSLKDLLDAVEAQPYQQVIVLPNNPNVILTAEQLSKVGSHQFRVISTRTMPQGLAAVMAFNALADLDQNVADMTEESRAVRTVEVTHAVRSTQVNGLRVKKGDAIAVVDNQLTSAGHDYFEVIEGALGGLPLDHFSQLTLFTGKGVGDGECQSLADRLQERYPGLSLERLEGGQELYPFILSLV
ncbi:MAG: DAK2 domain-containing protein [Candidatus Dormibacteria bacterium]